MKALHGAASASPAVSIERCLEFLAAVDQYPQWYPDVVRRVAIVERGEDGRAKSAQTSLHVAHGPLVKDFELLLAVDVEPPGTVALRRIAHGASDQQRFAVTWRLRGEAHGTRLALELEADLSVPRLLPVGGVGDAIAAGFVRAAVDELERRARDERH